jgi:hypothetical protein
LREADAYRTKPMGISEKKKPIKIDSRNNGSRTSRPDREPTRVYPDANKPWSPFEEQVAILEVEGGLSCAEAVRSVKKNARLIVEITAPRD